MKKFALLFIALVTAVVISACGNQSTSSSKGSDSKNEQITVKHQLDKNGTKVPKNPKK